MHACTGLHWSVSTSQGLSLRFRGFSHKLQSLLFKVLESLVALHLHEGLFQLAKEKALDAYRNVKVCKWVCVNVPRGWEIGWSRLRAVSD